VRSVWGIPRYAVVVTDQGISLVIITGKTVKCSVAEMAICTTIGITIASDTYIQAKEELVNLIIVNSIWHSERLMIVPDK